MCGRSARVTKANIETEHHLPPTARWTMLDPAQAAVAARRQQYDRSARSARPGAAAGHSSYAAQPSASRQDPYAAQPSYAPNDPHPAHSPYGDPYSEDAYGEDPYGDGDEAAGDEDLDEDATFEEDEELTHEEEDPYLEDVTHEDPYDDGYHDGADEL